MNLTPEQIHDLMLYLLLCGVHGLGAGLIVLAGNFVENSLKKTYDPMFAKIIEQVELSEISEYGTFEKCVNTIQGDENEQGI